jgi:hypothetical protein
LTFDELQREAKSNPSTLLQVPKIVPNMKETKNAKNAQKAKANANAGSSGNTALGSSPRNAENEEEDGSSSSEEEGFLSIDELRLQMGGRDFANAGKKFDAMAKKGGGGSGSGLRSKVNFESLD